MLTDEDWQNIDALCANLTNEHTIQYQYQGVELLSLVRKLHSEVVRLREEKIKSMKYDDLFEEVYGESNSDEAIEKVQPNIRLAFRVIGVLENRKGFDDWWDCIDSESRTEIFQQLLELIEKEKKK